MNNFTNGFSITNTVSGTTRRTIEDSAEKITMINHDFITMLISTHRKRRLNNVRMNSMRDEKQ